MAAQIYADDVKCIHGATIGQLNDESIFYLRARGIPLEKVVWDRLEQNEQVAVNR